MAAITANESTATRSAVASSEQVGAAFADHRQELTWLAEFLTDDELLASACIEDARNNDGVIDNVLPDWPREATVRSAVDLKRTRIAELAWVYERGVCCRRYRPLSEETLEFVVKESDAIRLRLDSLCRFVLIVCGLEQRSTGEAALLLGLSKHAVEVAYSRAVQSLEVLYCQAFVASEGCVAA